MKRDELRKKTVLIIRKNGKYLVGRQIYDGPLVWSLSRWDAWRTRDRETARRIARATGGVTILFNPIIGEERIL